MKWLLVVLTLLHSSAQSAIPKENVTDIHWFTLNANFHYKDLMIHCHTQSLPRKLYLGVEAHGLHVTKAVLRDSMHSVLFSAHVLSPVELQGTRLQLKESGATRLKDLSLQAQGLNWLFFHSSGTLEECMPSSHLATLGPNSFVFSFGLEQEAGSFSSNLGKFRGTLKTGGAYQATLWLTQSSSGLPQNAPAR